MDKISIYLKKTITQEIIYKVIFPSEIIFILLFCYKNLQIREKCITTIKKITYIFCEKII